MINLDRIRMSRDFNYLQRPVIKDKKNLFLDRKIGVNDEIDQLRIASYLKNEPKPRQVLDADEMKARRIRDFGIKVDLGVKDLVDKYKNKTFKVIRRDDNGNIMKNPETGMPIFRNVLWREILGNDSYLLDRVNQITGYGNEESHQEALILRTHIMNKAVDPTLGYNQSMLSALKRLIKKYPPENWAANIQKYKKADVLGASTYYLRLNPKPPNKASSFDLLLLFHFMGYNKEYVSVFLEHIRTTKAKDEAFDMYKEIQNWKKIYKIKFPDDIYGEELGRIYSDDYMRSLRIGAFADDYADESISGETRIKAKFNDIKMTAKEISEKMNLTENQEILKRFSNLYNSPRNEDEWVERDVYNLSDDTDYDPFDDYIEEHQKIIDTKLRMVNPRFADLMIKILDIAKEKEGNVQINVYYVIYFAKIVISVYEYKISVDEINANFLSEYINYDKLRRKGYTRDDMSNISDLKERKTEKFKEEEESTYYSKKELVKMDPFELLENIELNLTGGYSIDEKAMSDYLLYWGDDKHPEGDFAWRYYFKTFLDTHVFIDKNFGKYSFLSKDRSKYISPTSIKNKIVEDNQAVFYNKDTDSWFLQTDVE